MLQRAHGFKSCTVARSCPSVCVLGADGAIVEHCTVRGACFDVAFLMWPYCLEHPGCALGQL
eukprot:9358709-Alexandrium_andersonii.AAC.1